MRLLTLLTMSASVLLGACKKQVKQDANVKATGVFHVADAAPTFYSWTKNEDALRNPVEFVRRATAGAFAQNEKNRPRDFPDELAAGNGLYLAQTPYASRSYGDIAISLRLKSGTSVASQDRFHSRREAIYSNAAVVLYNWLGVGAGKALVVREFDAVDLTSIKAHDARRFVLTLLADKRPLASNSPWLEFITEYSNMLGFIVLLEKDLGLMIDQSITDEGVVFAALEDVGSNFSTSYSHVFEASIRSGEFKQKYPICGGRIVEITPQNVQQLPLSSSQLRQQFLGKYNVGRCLRSAILGLLKSRNGEAVEVLPFQESVDLLKGLGWVENSLNPKNEDELRQALLLGKRRDKKFITNAESVLKAVQQSMRLARESSAGSW